MQPTMLNLMIQIWVQILSKTMKLKSNQISQIICKARLFAENGSSQEYEEDEEWTTLLHDSRSVIASGSSDKSFLWSIKYIRNLSFQFFRFPESASVNLVINSTKLVNYFRVFFDKSICERITKESNTYAQNNRHLLMYLKKLKLRTFIESIIVMGFHSFLHCLH